MSTTLVNPGFNDLQWLAEHAAGAGMIVSCYADITVGPAGHALWREHLKNEAKRIEETLPADSDVRTAFQQDVAAVQTVLSMHPPAARGMAVFAASRRHLLQAYALHTAVPNRLALDQEPYLVPLLELLHRQRRYLVVHTDSHRGHIYNASPGVVQLIEEIDEFVPKKQRAAGELWGKQQATIARHREDHVAHYFKELIDETARAWREGPYDGIVLLGEQEITARVRRDLPEELQARIVGTAPHAWAGRQVPLPDKVEAIRAQARHDQEQQLFEDIRRRLSEHRYVAAGPQAVIDAIDNDQVGYSGAVVMESDQGQFGAHCTGCGRLYAQSIATCPSCGAACEKTNLCQAIALLAAGRHVTVHFVEPGHGLQAYGGVVALLARETPWMAPARGVVNAPSTERHT